MLASGVELGIIGTRPESSSWNGELRLAPDHIIEIDNSRSPSPDLWGHLAWPAKSPPSPASRCATW